MQHSAAAPTPAAWPGYLATHSTEQTLYFDDDGLLARHDYDVERDRVHVSQVVRPVTTTVEPRRP